MRKTLLMSAAMLGLAGSVLAQGRDSTTQTPPAPNSSMSMPQPSGSVPRGSATASETRPGDALGGTVPSDRGMSGMRSMRGQEREMPSQGAVGDVRPSTRRQQSAGSDGMSRGSTGDYDGGRSVPMSARASNTTAGDTRSEIAPRLPAPGADANPPEAYLAAAQRALAAGRTGQAQEALERAETRLLTRSTEASAAGTADSNPLVGQISEARRALGRRDTAAARQAINTAMAGGSDMGGSGSGSSSSMSR